MESANIAYKELEARESKAGVEEGPLEKGVVIR